MGFVGGELGYQVLRRISRDGNTGHMDGSVYRKRGKLETLFGPEIWEQIKGRTVIDFGCGSGGEVVEMARHGAHRVIGIDIQEHFLAQGQAAAKQAGVLEQCEFTTGTDEKAEVVLSVDSFEHFDDPAEILIRMHRLLAPGGRVIVSFGPTWYHPLGGHLFSVFPWAHLIFTERSLIRWRSDFKQDGATRFSEVAGGLNQMTIQRFEKLVEQSPLKFEEIKLVPIRKMAFIVKNLPIASNITREWTTAVVNARLISR